MECSFSLNPFEGFQSCKPLPPPPPLLPPAAIGISLALLAAAVQAGGLNLQRWAGQRKRPALNALGVVMCILCGPIDMVSFSFAAQSLLAPFGSLTLIINLLLASPLHGDPVSTSDLVSTLLVFSGVALCLANASTEMVSLSCDELTALWLRPQFHTWVLLCLGVVSAAGLNLRRVGDGPSAAFCWPLISGVMGGGTTLCAKTLGELVKVGAPYATLARLGLFIPIFAISQIVALNRGVSKFSSLLVVPVFVASFVTCNAVGGGIFFDEFSSLTASQRMQYPFGLLLLVAGVLILAAKGSNGGEEREKKSK
jgi:drug/metabolite transporter superfamily protein YnfA